MRWIVDTALRLRFVVVALAFVLMVAGSRAPSATRRSTSSPSSRRRSSRCRPKRRASRPSKSRALVTVPLETAINGVAGLKTLRSKSVLGLSSVVLIFEDGTDLMARAATGPGTAAAHRGTALPAVAHPPVILSPLSSLSRVMKIGMTSEKLSQIELTTLAKWTIRPRLMSIPGVANVAIWGQRDRQFQVLVDPERLRASSVTLADVITAAREGTSTDRGRLPRHAAAAPRRRACAGGLQRSTISADPDPQAGCRASPAGRPASRHNASASATSRTSSKGSRRRSATRSSTTSPGCC